MKLAEHALTLTDDEVRDLLHRLEVMTRQPVKPQPIRRPLFFEGSWFESHSGDGPAFEHTCPLGAVGGSVYAQEAWYCDDYRCQETPFEKPYWSKGEEEGMLFYRAEVGAGFRFEDGSSPTWHDADTMPEWAARIRLRIDEVRVERIDGVWVWVRKCSVTSTTGRPS